MKYIFLFLLSFCANINIYSQEFNGFWEAQGNGLFVEVTDNQFALYSYTSNSLIPIGVLSLVGDQIGTNSEPFGELSIENDVLHFSFAATVDIGSILFDQVTSMPAVTEPTDDPKVNFEIFWAMFEEYCCLFEILDVDWQLQYDLYFPQIDDDTSNTELFGYMSNMIAELNDGHCYLVDTENQIVFGAGPTPSSLWYEYADLYHELYEEKYMDEGSHVYHENNSVMSATINNGAIGYIAVNSFEIGDDNHFKDNLLFESILDEVFGSFQETEGLIIDIRMNEGGFDSNSRVLANKLTKITQTVFSKQDRLKDSYDSFSEPQFIEIFPSSGISYVDKPVMVLTSNMSASAADIFALMAKEIKCVTTIGDNTYGNFSDIIQRTLPNQWLFSLSTQRYLDVNGINLEQIGVAPDVLIEEDLNALLNEESDNVLEYAIENIASSCDIISSVPLKEKNNFSIYPNPFVKTVFMESEFTDIQSGLISIINVAGNKVFEQKVEKSQTLDLKDLPNGIYTIIIETSKQRINRKLVKLAN